MLWLHIWKNRKRTWSSWYKTDSTTLTNLIWISSNRYMHTNFHYDDITDWLHHHQLFMQSKTCLHEGRCGWVECFTDYMDMNTSWKGLMLRKSVIFNWRTVYPTRYARLCARRTVCRFVDPIWWLYQLQRSGDGPVVCNTEHLDL